jgi:hydroxylaminobenzene mutase
MLLMVLATALLAVPNRVGPKSVVVLQLAAFLTWAMALSEVANSWWGTKEMLPIAAREAGASGGASWQELVVTLTHLGAGFGLIAAWALLVIGLRRGTARAASA